MFNVTNFNIMLVSKGYDRQKLADYLKINRSSMYRKISNDGSFTKKEIEEMIRLFGEQAVMDALFFNTHEVANCDK